jgi:hypothetical protein
MKSKLLYMQYMFQKIKKVFKKKSYKNKRDWIY